jgi:hypothetical protein
LYLNGAAANGNEIRLQDAYDSHVPGVVWALSRQSIGNGFETTFQFRISRNINAGGDGFAFVLQNSGTTAIGGSGCDLGYGGINNSLIIEFDTYPSNYISGACPGIADPNDNHVGLLRNGNPIHSVDSPAAVLNNITLEDGAVHTVNIAYVASTETLTVQIDGNLVATFQTSLNGIGLTDGMAWVGFTSGQGFARQDIDILSWSFNRPAQTPTCQVDASYVDGYRAPISNNPPTGKRLEYASCCKYEIDKKFIDHLGVPWYHIIGFLREGNYENNPNLPMWTKDLTNVPSNCNNLPIDTQYTIPDVNSVYGSWTSFTGQFDTWPIDISQVCTSSSRTEIHALGINPPPPNSLDYPRGFHNGVDIFMPISSNIFAMSNGIVVGIGVGDDTEKTHQAWGGTLGEDTTGYAVLIRHGHLYVLYGHLKTISDAIWVGAPVDAGMLIGTLGSFNEPHLHIEVHMAPM